MMASFQDGRMGTPRGAWPATTLPILTQIRVFVKTSSDASTSPERVLERLVEARKPKRIAGRPSPGRNGVAAVKQQLGLRAEHQPEQRRGRRNDRRTVQQSPNLACHLPLAPNVGGHRVHRSADLWVLERQTIQTDEVIDMDPGKPLAAITQGPAGEHPERQSQESKSQGTATEDEGGANQRHAHAERLRLARSGLPLLTDPSQEGVARPTLLGHELVATVPVVIDPRSVDQHRWTPVGWGAVDGLDDGRRSREPARQDLLHPPSRPSTLADAGAGQVDHALDSGKLVDPIALGGARIPLDEANARLRRSALGTSTQADDVVPVGRQAARQPPTDVARSARDQDSHPDYYARLDRSGLEAAHAPLRTGLLQAMERLRQQRRTVVLATLADSD